MLACIALFGATVTAHATEDAVFRGLDVETQTEMVSEARVALVIGNAAYEKGELANPERDARAVAARLEQLGFDTMLGINMTQSEMIEAIRAFGTRLEAGGTGLFYFAGHGLQVDGENFLVPVGADIRKEAHVESESVAVARVLGQMEGADNRMNLLILDACRNNPYESKFRSAGGAGLTAIDPPSGTWIAFATSPGRLASDGEGDHGLYTQALLDNLGAEVRPLERTFKAIRAQVSGATDGEQTPQEYTSVTGEFFFLLPEKESPVGTRGATVAEIDPAELGSASGPVTTTDAPTRTEDDRRAHWGFGTFSPFVQMFVEGPMAPVIGNQGIGIFFAPALALSSDPSHGSNLSAGTNVVVGLMGGVRIYNRFNLGTEATGFKVSAIATAPILFADPEDEARFLPGFGGGVSIDAHVNEVLWVEVGGAIVVDTDPWFIPNLSVGAAF